MAFQVGDEKGLKIILLKDFAFVFMFFGKDKGVRLFLDGPSPVQTVHDEIHFAQLFSIQNE